MRPAFRPFLRKALPQAGLYVALGMAIGYLFMMTAFPYYCDPFDGGLHPLVFVLAVAGIGFLAAALYPDIAHVLASALLLPLLGAVFMILLLLAPALDPDIVNAGAGEIILEGAKSILGHLALCFPTLFISGFVSMYLFEPA